jgi:hypothetical protein
MLPYFLSDYVVFIGIFSVTLVTFGDLGLEGGLFVNYLVESSGVAGWYVDVFSIDSVVVKGDGFFGFDLIGPRLFCDYFEFYERGEFVLSFSGLIFGAETFYGNSGPVFCVFYKK